MGRGSTWPTAGSARPEGTPPSWRIRRRAASCAATWPGASGRPWTGGGRRAGGWPWGGRVGGGGVGFLQTLLPPPPPGLAGRPGGGPPLPLRGPRGPPGAALLPPPARGRPAAAPYRQPERLVGRQQRAALQPLARREA